MKKTLVLLVCLGLTIVFSACSSKKVVKPEETATPTDQQTQQSTLAPRESDRQQQWRKPDERVTEQDLALIQPGTDVPRYKESKEIFDDIYFSYDQYDIRTDAEPTLQEIASWLLKNNDANVLIEGHCDERGTNEYNLALGDRRAKAVRDYLFALGIPASRIEILSYGEEQPICMEQSEACWAKNRRAHFIIVR